ncbi:MAG: ABC-type transporter, integral rane subunit [Chloroflexi bacterium]|nr:ABC-type transporter, integral rane subunit [Chloroflexota bacterium]
MIRTAPARSSRRRLLSYQSRLKGVGFLFVLPAIVFFLVFFLYPVTQAVRVSFTSWNLFTPPVYRGFKNFTDLVNDDAFRNAFRITVTYGVITTFFVFLASLSLALLTDRPGRLAVTAETLYFLPAVLPLAVVAILWSYLLDNLGLVNNISRSLLGTNFPFLSSSRTALYTISFVEVWADAGFFMLMFKAGLRAIPPSFYDAAKIDGASPFGVIRHVTLPLLRPTIFVVITICLINTFQQFDLFYLMTSGGPGDSTQSMTFKIFQDALLSFRMGFATAQAMILFLMLLFLTLVQMRLFRTDYTYD